jgi:hypothetical protein
MSAVNRGQIKADTPTRELWQVAGIGEVDQLENLLARGADVNACDGVGMTALMRAAYHGRLQMVCALIELGADLNAVDNDGLTAVMMAKHSGHADVVSTLVSFGAEVRTRPVRPTRVIQVDEEDDFEALVDLDPAPTKRDPKVRTLHDPPEIWDLVHETRAPVDRRATFVELLPSPRHLGLAAIALIICGGVVLGFFTLRGSSNTEATRVRAADNKSKTASIAKTTKPAPASSLANKQPASKLTSNDSSDTMKATEAKRTDQQPTSKLANSDVGDNARSDEPNRTVSSSGRQLIIRPTGDLVGVRTVDQDIAVTAPAVLSAKQSATKARRQTPTNSRTSSSANVARSNNKDNALKATASGPGSDGEKNANSPAAKKESVKAQSQQLNDSTRVNTTPKPKVIQWP